MEKEGAVPADHPRFFAAGEMLSTGMRIPFTLAGERFKKMQSLSSSFPPKSITFYSPGLTKTSKQNGLAIIQDLARRRDHVNRYSAAVTTTLAYGKVPPSYKVPKVHSVNQYPTKFGLTMRAGA
ncbi:hypothetical protein IW262DRAFT_788221 [Armillaria fumosa]|nr:hypothetical protein IW262DRAFT_788221 [Armillaria fumosa]